MMKKLGLSLALAGIMIIGSTVTTLNKGDTPTPPKPGVTYNVWDTPAPSYGHADFPTSADGNGGGIVSSNHGKTI